MKNRKRNKAGQFKGIGPEHTKDVTQHLKALTQLNTNLAASIRSRSCHEGYLRLMAARRTEGQLEEALSYADNHNEAHKAEKQQVDLKENTTDFFKVCVRKT